MAELRDSFRERECHVLSKIKTKLTAKIACFTSHLNWPLDGGRDTFTNFAMSVKLLIKVSCANLKVILKCKFCFIMKVLHAVMTILHGSLMW